MGSSVYISISNVSEAKVMMHQLVKSVQSQTGEKGEALMFRKDEEVGTDPVLLAIQALSLKLDATQRSVEALRAEFKEFQARQQ